MWWMTAGELQPHRDGLREVIKFRFFRTLVAVVAASTLWNCGSKVPLTPGSRLGAAILEGTGETRDNGQGLGKIYTLSQIIPATSGLAGWTAAQLPFTGTAVAIGQPVTDGQTPFVFEFDYPPNNFTLAETRLVINTSRDNSDTEGIFVDGVFSGRPPTNMVNTSSPKITHAIYFGNGGATVNKYYIDWSLAHYKINTINTFDLDLSSLLTGTSLHVYDVLSDGYLPVVTGDDSPVHQGLLIVNGYTISQDELDCEQSSNYSFQNVYLHNDGNSIGQNAFSGTVGTPFTSWSNAVGTYSSVEFYFDTQLPKVATANINLTTGSLSLRVKRSATGKAAIVVNGIGVSETGFDRSGASSVVESWDDSSSVTTAWDTFMSGIPANATDKAVTLNLIQLLGASRFRDLVAQGKLNIVFAGSLSVNYGQNNTSTRGFQVAVAGPELSLAGTFYTEVCQVPDNPDSPLTGDGTPPSSINDGQGPVISSVQISEITSTSAKILWLTDEASSSQVSYGIGSPNTSTTEDTTPATFHQVTLTGLLPYKYYYIKVLSNDSFGNSSTSSVKLFLTLR